MRNDFKHAARTNITSLLGCGLAACYELNHTTSLMHSRIPIILHDFEITPGGLTDSEPSR